MNTLLLLPALNPHLLEPWNLATESALRWLIPMLPSMASGSTKPGAPAPSKKDPGGKPPANVLCARDGNCTSENKNRGKSSMIYTHGCKDPVFWGKKKPDHFRMVWRCLGVWIFTYNAVDWQWKSSSDDSGGKETSIYHPKASSLLWMIAASNIAATIILERQAPCSYQTSAEKPKSGHPCYQHPPVPPWRASPARACPHNSWPSGAEGSLLMTSAGPGAPQVPPQVPRSQGCLS